MNVPCGCDARKEIMFEHGDCGPKEAAVILAAILIPLALWRLNR